MANMTCGGSCYHIRESGKDSDAIEHYYNMVDALVDTARTKSGAEFNYNGRNVEIFYFKGRKGDVFPVCGEPAPLEDDVNKKIPSCSEGNYFIFVTNEAFNNLVKQNIARLLIINTLP